MLYKSPQTMLSLMNMSPHTRETFYRIKPLCELVIQDPSPEHLTTFRTVLDEMKLDMVQELQQYLMLPFIHHLQCEDNKTKYELHMRVLEPMKEVLARVKVCNFQICMKILGLLIKVVFNKSKLVIISEVPEELKLSVVQCLTTLMLDIDNVTRIRILETQLSLLAQSIFVSVHLAKLEKLRTLRLAALNCLDVLMMTHSQITDSKSHIADPLLEEAVLNMMAGILPGVLAALQDVVTSPDNPGHAVIVAALRSTHRIICIIMHSKNLSNKGSVTAKDFLKLVSQKGEVDNDVSTKENIRDAKLNAPLRTKDNSSLAEYLRTKRKNTKSNVLLKPKGSVTKPRNVKRRQCAKDVGSRFKEKYDSILTDVEAKPKRSPQWYAMASEKLAYVVKNLIPLVTHEHFRVRMELAVLCYRILSECSATMEPSLAMTLDVLITLSTDPYKEISEYCSKAVDIHFASASKERKTVAIDSLCENFFTTLNCLPRILINIDSSRKLSVLTLLYGYLKILCDDSRPQRLTSALSASDGFDRLCDALLTAADLQTDLALLSRHAGRDVTSTPSTDTPWCRLRHLDNKESERRLQEICQKLGAAECAELFLDRLLELFQERRSCELVYIINWVGSAPNSSPNLAKRIISKYIEEDIWYLPLEVGSGEVPITKVDTLDTSVYNPRAWTKDSVPGLYEGATETRYTGISYSQPRVRYVEPNTCKTIAQAQKNMAFSCLVTEGLGMMAKHLKKDYQPFLLKTLCLLLERVGSKYENLHLTGLKALNDVAFAFDHTNVTELIAENADYFTSQITSRLKKAWNTQSALQILSVVMEYSDSSILNYLYGIVEDVLIQCCDKYYQRHLYAYLQVFLTFVNCIRKWFLVEQRKPKTQTQAQEIDIMKDVLEFVNNSEEALRLLTAEEESVSNMTAEEMYREDIKRKEEDILDYDDTVVPESPPLPQHIRVTVTILKRCVNFIGGSMREESILSVRILTLGLPILKEHENELLPLVHLTWAPLVGRFGSTEPTVLKGAFELFVVLAALAKDFLRSRAVKDVLHPMYKFLACTAQESQLKDAGSAYRLSSAYNLQLAALGALPELVADLALDEERLVEAMTWVQRYLSNKQPKPLQMLAVKFFKAVLSLNYCVAWYHLRRLCNNEVTLACHHANVVPLATVVGTPYETPNTEYDTNVRLIFYVHK